ncbi:TetR/AcrR family transcriptional regulator [uncultured Leifsonia sp.]|uniref:TetR/AcrR family transcriptional regulator n=1 Tax=uncultured Leifsonia sp. TaxID=340359 RepID=UPI0028D0FFA4|nr:TetR/AcrR family transcriptional regulator [uncultured Leifsonia sp.]
MPRTIDHDARRAELAEAVWRVILHRGIGAVSVRTVAAEAGVVVGSLRHLFPTRAGLIAFSAELMIARATERLRSVVSTGDAPVDALALLRQLLPLTPDSRAELEVNLALIAETPALPELADIRDEAAAGIRRICVHVVCVLTGAAADAPHVAMDARRLHALVDGLALQLLHAPELDGVATAADQEAALEVLRAEIAGLAARGGR